MVEGASVRHDECAVRVEGQLQCWDSIAQQCAIGLLATCSGLHARLIYDRQKVWRMSIIELLDSMGIEAGASGDALMR